MIDQSIFEELQVKIDEEGQIRDVSEPGEGELHANLKIVADHRSTESARYCPRARTTR